jgi:hypothetical protein
VTSLRIKDHLGAGGMKRAAGRKAKRESEKSDEKTAKIYHGNKNRSTLIAAATLATGESGGISQKRPTEDQC